ncbi:MAG TPA: four helix bundle protein [Terriglobales bacterium]|nr:four helix bundle protein [Terriglobales bacterium]
MRVWKTASEMAPRVYKLAEVRQELEKYAPGDQMRRVAVSIPANQAEGRSRMHTAEFQ